MGPVVQWCQVRYHLEQILKAFLGSLRIFSYHGLKSLEYLYTGIDSKTWICLLLSVKHIFLFCCPLLPWWKEGGRKGCMGKDKAWKMSPSSFASHCNNVAMPLYCLFFHRMNQSYKESSKTLLTNICKWEFTNKIKEDISTIVTHFEAGKQISKFLKLICAQCFIKCSM